MPVLRRPVEPQGDFRHVQPPDKLEFALFLGCGKKMEFSGRTDKQRAEMESVATYKVSSKSLSVVQGGVAGTLMKDVSAKTTTSDRRKFVDPTY